ncbi:Pilus assembly protein [Georgfuchsia toluolica]|uniref:Pilus assembly protein n=1 Tax=Georgfuchsia toluolica TaxID=424218 RepID=A0A916N252_9PROT|nr:FimV/HubP family polar landmark protein [Georgfuchsia toluolica]CAG4883449.1 Pilus assembly protein [Georgfuchsia toluolica]
MVSALAAPFAVNAAGLGKITVLSALGQPLRAELDITASREELPSLTARVAPVEAFRQANVEYASVLSAVRFVLDKRSDGKPYFRIQTDHAVNDPFIDFLVELNWSSGRLVREYAFLLDPPELKTDNVSAAVTAPVAPAPVDTSSSASAPPEVTVESARSNEARRAPPIESQKPEMENKAASNNIRKVKPGDTLSKIAVESAPEGVTLNQMLVALFNSNRDAFIDGNMNRLRAGRILNVPDAEKAAAISAGEAHKVVVVQSAAFNAYRNSLAAAAANQAPVEQPRPQSSSGKITPKVEEKAPSASGQDKLLVSRSEAQAKAGKGKLGEEDIIARDKALKEANSRIGELEKNLADLKKLAELKSQPATDTQKTGQAATTVPVPAAAKPVPGGPAASPIATAPVAAAAAPTAEKPQAKPKKKIVSPPPPPEPSFVEDNPVLVYGGGAALAAVLGFLGFLGWKRKRDVASAPAVTVDDLAASSVFGVAASENLAASAVPRSDFGHSTLRAVDTGKEGVDPIQEAEVYMAYGRDGQAEEILVDAMRKDPGNLAVYLKLLEIYAGRKSLPQFNELAGKLHSRTAGNGSEWNKAAVLGRSLDPANPLYSGATAPEPAQHGQTAAVESTPASQSVDAAIALQAPPLQGAPAKAAAATANAGTSTLDFDLDLGAAPVASVEAPTAAPAKMAASDLDFDLDLETAAPVVSAEASVVAPVKAEASDLDFDLDLGDDENPAVEAKQGGGLDIDFNAPAQAGNALDFDFDLGASAPASLEQAAPPLDLSLIDLDLKQTDVLAAAGNAGNSAEVATKLELAHAYEEMGDHEGARELLQEVLTEGSPAQQETARSKLAQLG